MKILMILLLLLKNLLKSYNIQGTKITLNYFIYENNYINIINYIK